MGYREACNECHYRKVRCEQAASGGACLNCQNQGKECVYGTTRRMGRPKYKTQQQQQQHQRRRTGSIIDTSSIHSSSTASTPTIAGPHPSAFPPHSEPHLTTGAEGGIDPRALASAPEDHAMPTADLGQMFTSPSPEQTFALEHALSSAENGFEPFLNPAFSNGDWFSAADQSFSQQFMDPATCFDPNFGPASFEALQRSDSGIAFPSVMSNYPPEDSKPRQQGFGSMQSMPPSLPSSPGNAGANPSNNTANLYNKLTTMQYSVSRMRDQLDPAIGQNQQLLLDPTMFQLASSLVSIVSSVAGGSSGRKGSNEDPKAAEQHGFLLLMTVSAIMDAFEALSRAIGARRSIRCDTQFSLGAFSLSDDGLSLDVALNIAQYYQRCFHTLLQRLGEQTTLEPNAAGLLPKVASRIESVQTVTHRVHEAMTRDPRSFNALLCTDSE